MQSVFGMNNKKKNQYNTKKYSPIFDESETINIHFCFFGAVSSKVISNVAFHHTGSS